MVQVTVVLKVVWKALPMEMMMVPKLVVLSDYKLVQKRVEVLVEKKVPQKVEMMEGSWVYY